MRDIWRWGLKKRGKETLFLHLRGVERKRRETEKSKRERER